MPKSLSSSTPLPRAGEGTRCRTLRKEWGWEGAGTPSHPVPPPPGSLQHLHLPANSLQPCLCSPRPTGCPQLHPVPPKTIRTDQDPKAAPPNPPQLCQGLGCKPRAPPKPPPTYRAPTPDPSPYFLSPGAGAAACRGAGTDGVGRGNTDRDILEEGSSRKPLMSLY